MREDQTNCILGKKIKAFALRNDVTKEGMILFDIGFLVRLIGVTEEQFGLFYAVQAVFK